MAERQYKQNSNQAEQDKAQSEQIEQQRKLFEISMLQQQAEQLQQRMQFIDQQINDLQILQLNLENFDKTKEKEMLTPFGRGIFIDAEIKNKEKFFIDIGMGIIVKKNLSETLNIIEEQIKKLNNMRQETLNELERIVEKVNSIVR